MILFSQTAYLQHTDSSSRHCLFFFFFQFCVCPMLIIERFIDSLASLSHTYGSFTDTHDKIVRLLVKQICDGSV